MGISFKGAHFLKDVILFAVFFYHRYGVSYRDLVTEMGRHRKGHTDRSWRMDETYIRVKGQCGFISTVPWTNSVRQLISCCQRDATRLQTKSFARALAANGLPRKIVIDKSGANTAGIIAVNRMLKRFGCPIAIEMVRIKYLTDVFDKDCFSLVSWN